MESRLTSASANSLRTERCISSGPIDLCMLSLSGCVKTYLFLQCGRVSKLELGGLINYPLDQGPVDMPATMFPLLPWSLILTHNLLTCSGLFFRDLFTISPAPDVESNSSTLSSSCTPLEQPLPISIYSPVRGILPLIFGNGS